MMTLARSRLPPPSLLALAAVALVFPAQATNPPDSSSTAASESTAAPVSVPSPVPATASHTSEAAEEPPSTQIVVPPPVPTGILIAWKPVLLSVRVDNGSGQKFGSDKIQLARGLARYTFLLAPNLPLVGRVEGEGGQFNSDTQSTYVGSTGTDFTVRALIGVATRISQGLTVLASVGAITRFQYGRASGGAPEIGFFGAVSNMELELRLFPNITASLFAEVALAPVPYASETDLGTLSDASELRARIQFSFDLTRDVALDIGYDFTRWHSSFSESTILGNTTPNQALLIEDREHAMTLGVRWKL